MSMIHNERTKLTANPFNTGATSCFTVGVVAPLAATFYNFRPIPVSLPRVVIGVAFWLAVAAIFYYTGRRILEDLRL
jgi:hypothetical protein